MGVSAAHKSLPFGTRVVVRNQRTGRSITVRINDRGPFVAGRIIDLSTGAKNALGMDGLAPVCVEVVSYGSGKKHGYEKPGLGARLLQALNPLGTHDAKGTVIRSARGASRHTRTASAGSHRKHYARAHQGRERSASVRHHRHNSKRAGHRRQFAANEG
jgi:rare lipoprotein A